MNGYVSIKLSELLDNQSEEDVQKLLTGYSCPLNEDIGQFARSKAIDFCKQGIAQTHLVFAKCNDISKLCGYYTLTLKIYAVPASSISRTLAKKLLRYGVLDEKTSNIELPAPLIAQIGKNFANGANSLIEGSTLLDMACKQLQQVQTIVGGKLVYLECDRLDSLLSFYERNGFYSAAPAPHAHGNELVQMIRFL